MSQRPTPPTPEELAKRIRDLCRDWATLSRAQIEQIASYLEELSTLRREMEKVHAAAKVCPLCDDKDPECELCGGVASRTERTP